MDVTIFYNDDCAADKVGNVQKMNGHTNPDGMIEITHGKGEYMNGVYKYATLYVPMRRVSKIAISWK